tara:strand:- start:1098 stop:1901 length:804 start_codon:yes stop_codon:yes gene_type:complete
LISFPGCKINIGLNIVSKRNDGFHNLESVFYPINWTDVIELQPANETSVINHGNNLEIEKEENIVWKAVLILKQDFTIPEFDIHLLKNVPSGAGLGGGSANGSATLKLLNQELGLNISNNSLNEYAAKLGSDCPFFIQNKASFVTGRGEIIEPAALSLKNYWIYIIYPQIHISTALAFSNLKPKESDQQLESLDRLDISNWRNYVKNDFEESIFPEYPILKQLKNKMYNSGALYASMSGTGSSIYGIFDDRPQPFQPEFPYWIGELQ